MAGSDTPLSWADDLPAAEQFDALMSLALDDTLRPDEEAEFERLLAEEPDLGDVWEEWQGFDFAFRSAPSVEPPADFVASFEDRLLKRERRRRLWLGAGVGAIAVVLWSSLAMGLAGAGAYVMFNQADWLTFAVRVVAQWTASVQSQVSMLASALTTVLSMPQVQGMVFAYMVFSLMALWFWARFLHRSVGEQRAAAARA